VALHTQLQKNAKEFKLESGERPIATSATTSQKFISFDEEDRVHIQDPHHHSLVSK